MREGVLKMIIWKLIRTIILMYLSLQVPLMLLDNGQLGLCLLTSLLLNAYVVVSFIGFYKSVKE